MSKTKHGHDHHHRREQFTAAPRRRVSSNAVVLVAAAVFILAAALMITRGSTPGVDSAVTSEAIAAGQDFDKPSALFDDGRARFFQYATAAGRVVRFFVLKSSDGQVRAAADACAVCYRQRKGYRQEGDDMVCNNCGRHFPSVNVNVITGGCNPIPLDRAVDSGHVVVRAAALEQAASYF